MSLTSYDRLFPSQDVLPATGRIGNLIAAPLQRRRRDHGATVFLDVGPLEPHEDQWAYLSSLPVVTPRAASRISRHFGTVAAGVSVNRLATPTRTVPQAPTILHVRLDAGVTIDGADLSPALAATLEHAASMPNPVFYEPQRLGASTCDARRFLRSYDETVDASLVLPRGLLDRLADIAKQAGSRLDILDERRARGDRQAELARHATRSPPGALQPRNVEAEVHQPDAAGDPYAGDGTGRNSEGSRVVVLRVSSMPSDLRPVRHCQPDRATSHTAKRPLPVDGLCASGGAYVLVVNQGGIELIEFRSRRRAHRLRLATAAYPSHRWHRHESSPLAGSNSGDQQPDRVFSR